MSDLFNEEGVAIRNGELKLYDFNQVTGEFNGDFYYQIPQWTGLPAHSTQKEPPTTRKNEVACFDADKDEWVIFPDFRGELAWRVDNQSQVTIETIGAVEFPLTLLKPATKFDKWDGEKWVTDMAAYQDSERQKTDAEIKVRLQAAAIIIAPLKEMQEIGALSTEEYRVLLAWMKYRIAVLGVSKVNPQFPDEPSFNPADYADEEAGSETKDETE